MTATSPVVLLSSVVTLHTYTCLEQGANAEKEWLSQGPHPCCLCAVCAHWIIALNSSQWIVCWVRGMPATGVGTLGIRMPFNSRMPFESRISIWSFLKFAVGSKFRLTPASRSKISHDNIWIQPRSYSEKSRIGPFLWIQEFPKEAYSLYPFSKKEGRAVRKIILINCQTLKFKRHEFWVEVPGILFIP